MSDITFVVRDFEDTSDNGSIEYQEHDELEVAKAVMELWEAQQEQMKRSQVYPPEGFFDIVDPEIYQVICGAMPERESCQPRIRVRELVEEGWLIINCRYTQPTEKELEDCWLFCARYIEEESPGWNAIRKYKFITVEEPFSVVPKDGTILLKDGSEVYPFPPFKQPWPGVIFYPENYTALGMVNRLLKPSDDNPLTMLMQSGKQPYRGLAKLLVAELRRVADVLAIPLSFER